MQHQIIISIIWAFAVHGVIITTWIALLITDLRFLPYVEEKPDPEPEVTVILKPLIYPTPQLANLPKPQPKAAKPPEVTKTKALAKTKKGMREQDRRYARTSAEQAGTPTEPTNLIGDRDTLAASEQNPVMGADPNLPSQKGVNPLFEGQTETVARVNQDGSVGMDKTGAETETPQEASILKKNTPNINQAPKVEAITPEKEDSARPKNKHLKHGDLLPDTETGKERSSIQDKPKEKESAKERVDKGANKKNQGDITHQKPKKSGFSGYSKKNKIVG